MAVTSRFDGVVSEFCTLLMPIDGFDGVVDIKDVLEREENVIHFSFMTREPFIQRFLAVVLNALRTVASETISSNPSGSLAASS